MKTDKFFADALKELNEKNNITQTELAKKASISRAYLSQIMNHNVLPSKEIIEKISQGYGLNPSYFKEYRVLEIIEELEKYYWLLTENDIKKLKINIENIKSRKKSIDSFNYDKLTSKREVEFSPEYVISLNNLDNEQIKILKVVLNHFLEQNEKRKLRDSIVASDDYMAFENSKEYNEFQDKYGDKEMDSCESGYYMQPYVDRYLERIARERKKEN